MTEITFLRHFETEVEKDKPAEEWDLSNKGKKDMERFLEEKEFEEFDIVMTSPEHKAKKTAEAVADRAGTSLKVLEELSEFNREGKFIEKQEDYFEAVRRLLEDGKYGDWETREHAEKRLERFLEKAEKYGKVLAVSHGMILTVLLAENFGKQPFKFWKQLGMGEKVEVDIKKLRENSRKL